MLWGPALLISPVLEAGKEAVEAYFPKARWFDYYRCGAVYPCAIRHCLQMFLSF